MALPTYPPSLPSPSSNFVAYDRGTTAYFFQNVTTTQATTTVGYGNTQGPPAGSVVYAMPASKAHEGGTQDMVIAVDAYGSTSGAGPKAVVTLYGSLDGVSFYSIAPLTTVTTVGAMFSLAKLVTPGMKSRYLTAGVTVYGGSGGVIDSVTASMYA